APPARPGGDSLAPPARSGGVSLAPPARSGSLAPPAPARSGGAPPTDTTRRIVFALIVAAVFLGVGSGLLARLLAP
ncbi:MAG TPA: hypothetical protein VM925_07085, partial [Labilithrix sp.]|nr:hypothetical protein [Labilithrix sp.]